jgi:VanZ family protein
MALIFVLSSIHSPPQLPSAIGDKGAHAMLYSGLAALIVRALAGGWRPFAGGIAVAAVLFSTLYGVSDELHQLFVPTRTADLNDLAADAVGSAVAVAVLYAVHAVRAHLRRYAPDHFQFPIVKCKFLAPCPLTTCSSIVMVWWPSSRSTGPVC